LVVKQERQKRLCGMVGRLRFADVVSTRRNVPALASSGVAEAARGRGDVDGEGDRERGDGGEDSEEEEDEEEDDERDGSRGEMLRASSSAFSDGEGEGGDEGPRVSRAAAWYSRFMASWDALRWALGRWGVSVGADGAQRRVALRAGGDVAGFGRGSGG